MSLGRRCAGSIRTRDLGAGQVRQGRGGITNLLPRFRSMVVAGTIIGVWPHLVDSAAEYVQAVRQMADVVGVDYVCIGTDTKLTPGARPGGRGRGEGGANRGPGGGPGEGRQRPGERTNLAWADQKFGFYYAVVDEMFKQGFTPGEVGKIGGGNFCRAFDAATAGRA